MFVGTCGFGFCGEGFILKREMKAGFVVKMNMKK